MRNVTEAGLNLIKRFEGFCPADYPTIGHGHVVLEHERDQFATGITPGHASKLLL